MTRKITLEMPDQVFNRLQSLSRLNETHDPVLTVSRALAVYELLMQELAKGNTPALVMPDGAWVPVEMK